MEFKTPYSSAKILDYIKVQSTGFRLYRDHFMSPFNENRILFSLDRTTTPKVKFTLKGIGYGVSLVTSGTIEKDYRSGNINRYQRNYGHFLNLWGTFVPAQASIGIAGGDYIGTKYHYKFTNQVVNEDAFLNKLAVWMLESVGLDSGSTRK